MLIDQIQSYLESTEEQKEKKSFWASEAETPLFDLFHKWMGTKPTDPPDAEKKMIFVAGKMMELSLVETLDKMGLINKPDEKQHRVEMEREGVPVSGYIDVLFKDGTVGEIKTYYGDYQSRDLQAGKPKESYLKQLAIYMDYLKAKQGKLIYLHRGTGEMYEFILDRHDTIFTCRDIKFDIKDTYKRWAKLYQENILPHIEPKSEYRYKKPLVEINWRKLSKTDIQKARNNQKVIGDHPWAIQYSPFKQLVLQREGVEAGYNELELKVIEELTKGYTTWK